MPIIVDPITHIIDVPQNYLTPVAAGLYSFDTDQFRKDLSVWSATEEGRAEPFPYSHNTEYSVAGVTYARKVEILSPYSVRFEDAGTLYSVIFEGSNNNIFDQVNGIFVPNNVIPIPQNAAGLQTVSSGSGLDAGQDAKLTAINAWIDLMYKAMDLDAAKPNTYADDGSEVVNPDFTRTKTDNGNSTFTVQRS